MVLQNASVPVGRLLVRDAGEAQLFEFTTDGHGTAGLNGTVIPESTSLLGDGVLQVGVFVEGGGLSITGRTRYSRLYAP